MSATHTPGPWTFDPAIDADCGGIWAKTGCVGEFIEDPSNEDARLIAAAPDLLDAIEALIQSASPTKKDHPRMFAAWEQAKAAITKAKGEQQ